MDKISIESAEQMMYMLLDKEDMGDRIYEFAQELYQRYIRKIEENFEVDESNLDINERWYDAIYEEFFQAVYDEMVKFLTARQ